jgi:hypothetical protein
MGYKERLYKKCVSIINDVFQIKQWLNNKKMLQMLLLLLLLLLGSALVATLTSQRRIIATANDLRPASVHVV